MKSDIKYRAEIDVEPRMMNKNVNMKVIWLTLVDVPPSCNQSLFVDMYLCVRIRFSSLVLLVGHGCRAFLQNQINPMLSN